jgi:four helix bundle protein
MRPDECEMDQAELKRRTKQFALRIMKLVGALPGTIVGKVVSGQLVRAGTSVGANYRAACRARSTPEFISKLGTVEEKADELTAIMAASIRTARRNGK